MSYYIACGCCVLRHSDWYHSCVVSGRLMSVQISLVQVVYEDDVAYHGFGRPFSMPSQWWVCNWSKQTHINGNAVLWRHLTGTFDKKRRFAKIIQCLSLWNAFSLRVLSQGRCLSLKSNLCVPLYVWCNLAHIRCIWGRKRKSVENLLKISCSQHALWMWFLASDLMWSCRRSAFEDQGTQVLDKQCQGAECEQLAPVNIVFHDHKGLRQPWIGMKMYFSFIWSFVQDLHAKFFPCADHRRYKQVSKGIPAIFVWLLT